MKSLALFGKDLNDITGNKYNLTDETNNILFDARVAFCITNKN